MIGMINQFLPTKEVNEINSLLVLLSDPETFKKKLDELIAAHNEANLTIDAANQALKEAEAQKADAAKASEQSKSDIAALQKAIEDHDRRKAAADKCQTDASLAQERLNRRATELDNKEAEFNRRETEYQATLQRMKSLI